MTTPQKQTPAPSAVPKKNVGLFYLLPGLFVLTSLCLPLFLFANEKAGAAADGHTGVPPVVFWQTINFLGFVAILVIVLRKVVASHFSKRHEDYVEALSKAQVAKKQAEEDHHEVIRKLEKLKTEEATVSEKAKQDAERARHQILEEAATQVARLKRETMQRMELEKLKAENQIRLELINKAFEKTKTSLAGSLSGDDQRRLQNEFDQKMRSAHV